MAEAIKRALRGAESLSAVRAAATAAKRGLQGRSQQPVVSGTAFLWISACCCSEARAAWPQQLLCCHWPRWGCVGTGC